MTRRTALETWSAVALAGQAVAQEKAGTMHGLIGRMKAAAGKRDELAAILLESTGAMPGCLSYVVANDPQDPDALWVTEVWESEADHKASLSLPAVKAAIAKGRPLIAAFDTYHITEPRGGYGIQRQR